MTILIKQRLPDGSSVVPLAVDHLLRDWTRKSRSLGGYYSASGVIYGRDTTPQMLRALYRQLIGRGIVDRAYGFDAWDGVIVNLMLIQDGVAREINMAPEYWHNGTDVYYTTLGVVDTDQGAMSYNYTVQDDEDGALSYTTESGEDTFTDAGQDFTDWDTPSGNPSYIIRVTNTDDSESVGYLGDTVAATEIEIYQDVTRNDRGWIRDGSNGTPSSYNIYEVPTFDDAGQDFNDWAKRYRGEATHRIQVANTNGTVSWAYLGDMPSWAGDPTEIFVYEDSANEVPGWNDTAPTGLTANSYQVIDVSTEGARSNTGWADNDDSQDLYGEREYIVSLPGATSTAATAMRDRHQTEYAWPRSRLLGRTSDEDQLVISAVGLWGTTMWRYRAYSETGDADSVVTNLIGDTEFLSAGEIETNTLEVTADAYPMPQLIGDLLLFAVEQGDASGDLWTVGVYEDRELDYQAVDTTVKYELRDGRLYTLAGQPVVKPLLRPGFYLRGDGWMGVEAPPGTSNVWDAAGVAYCDEVQYERDTDTLTLSLQARDENTAIRQQILAGGR